MKAQKLMGCSKGDAKGAPTLNAKAVMQNYNKNEKSMKHTTER